MSAQMIVRIDPELKEKVNALAKAEGKNTSEVVRELLKEYVKQRDISGYIDELWERIGRKMRQRGINAAEVNRVIRKVRKER